MESSTELARRNHRLRMAVIKDWSTGGGGALSDVIEDELGRAWSRLAGEDGKAESGVRSDGSSAEPGIPGPRDS